MTFSPTRPRRLSPKVSWTLLVLLAMVTVVMQMLPFLSTVLEAPARSSLSLPDILQLGARAPSTADTEKWPRAHNCSVLSFLAGPDPTARAAYDPDLVCGPLARDKDVVCRMFFDRLGLNDDGDCTRATDDSTVPRIVYFVIFGEYSFTFLHYVSVMAAKRFIFPTALYVIGDAHPVGYWWKRLMRDCRGVRYVYRPRPCNISGTPVAYRQHLSDLVRLQVLYLNGGIYLDADMVMTRDPGPLLSHDITMGLVENNTGMGNAFIAAKRNSDFIRDWYDHYHHYNSTAYFENSLTVAWNMWHSKPSRLHVEMTSVYRPNWYEAHKLFKGWDFDWSQNYAVHVWTNGNPVPKSEAEIQTANTTVAQVFRNGLYGDPRPRKASTMAQGNYQDAV